MLLETESVYDFPSIPRAKRKGDT